MSKETERLFRPGECCIIMPDRSVYIFSGGDPELEFKPIYHNPIELYNDDHLFHQPPVFDHFFFSVLHAKPVGFVKCDSVEIFSKNRCKINDQLLSQSKQLP